MKRISLMLSALALSLACAGSASAQVVEAGAAGSVPAGLQGVIGGVGGLTVGAAVGIAVVGTLVIATIANDDETTTTTTTTASD